MQIVQRGLMPGMSEVCITVKAWLVEGCWGGGVKVAGAREYYTQVEGHGVCECTCASEMNV